MKLHGFCVARFVRLMQWSASQLLLVGMSFLMFVGQVQIASVGPVHLQQASEIEGQKDQSPAGGSKAVDQLEQPQPSLPQTDTAGSNQENRDAKQTAPQVATQTIFNSWQSIPWRGLFVSLILLVFGLFLLFVGQKRARLDPHGFKTKRRFRWFGVVGWGMILVSSYLSVAYCLSNFFSPSALIVPVAILSVLLMLKGRATEIYLLHPSFEPILIPLIATLSFKALYFFPHRGDWDIAFLLPSVVVTFAVWLIMAWRLYTKKQDNRFVKDLDATMAIGILLLIPLAIALVVCFANQNEQLLVILTVIGGILFFFCLMWLLHTSTNQHFKNNAAVYGILLVVATLSCAIVGVWDCHRQENVGSPERYSRVMYEAVQALFMNMDVHGDDAKEVAGNKQLPEAGLLGAYALTAARVLAVLLTVFVAYQIISLYCIDALSVLWMGWHSLKLSTQNPTLVCGLGHIGMQLVRELRSQRVPTLVVTNEPQSPNISKARRLGAIVVVANAEEIETIRRIPFNAIGDIFVVCGSDAINMKIAMNLVREDIEAHIDRETIIHKICNVFSRDSVSRCYIRLYNSDLMQTAERYFGGSQHVRAGGVTLIPFNSDQTAARDLISLQLSKPDIRPGRVDWKPRGSSENKQCLPLGIEASDEVGLYVIAGFHEMGREVALSLAQLGHFENLRRPRMWILADDLNTNTTARSGLQSVKDFLARYPKFRPPLGNPSEDESVQVLTPISKVMFDSRLDDWETPFSDFYDSAKSGRYPIESARAPGLEKERRQDANSDLVSSLDQKSAESLEPGFQQLAIGSTIDLRTDSVNLLESIADPIHQQSAPTEPDSNSGSESSLDLKSPESDESGGPASVGFLKPASSADFETSHLSNLSPVQQKPATNLDLIETESKPIVPLTFATNTMFSPFPEYPGDLAFIEKLYEFANGYGVRPAVIVCLEQDRDAFAWATGLERAWIEFCHRKSGSNKRPIQKVLNVYVWLPSQADLRQLIVDGPTGTNVKMHAFGDAESSQSLAAIKGEFRNKLLDIVSASYFQEASEKNRCASNSTNCSDCSSPLDIDTEEKQYPVYPTELQDAKAFFDRQSNLWAADHALIKMAILDTDALSVRQAFEISHLQPAILDQQSTSNLFSTVAEIDDNRKLLLSQVEHNRWSSEMLLRNYDFVENENLERYRLDNKTKPKLIRKSLRIPSHFYLRRTLCSWRSLEKLPCQKDKDLRQVEFVIRQLGNSLNHLSKHLGIPVEINSQPEVNLSTPVEQNFLPLELISLGLIQVKICGLQWYLLLEDEQRQAYNLLASRRKTKDSNPVESNRECLMRAIVEKLGLTIEDFKVASESGRRVDFVNESKTAALNGQSLKKHYIYDVFQILIEPETISMLFSSKLKTKMRWFNAEKIKSYSKTTGLAPTSDGQFPVDWVVWKVLTELGEISEDPPDPT